MAAAAYRPAAAYRRRKVFHIIPTGKEKKFSTLDKLFEKFFTMLKTVLKKIVSRETLSDLVPQLRLQFRERFSAERIEHSVIERAEEQATMLEFIRVRNFSVIGRNNISQNIKPH